MAGVLSFALGLESSAFTAGLDRAGGRLLAFLSVGKALQVAFDSTWAAIERGGRLNDLAARTGETVANLYQLEEAFAVVGISADSLPGMVNKLNKSLSGVGEMGEKTSEAFNALGLNMEDLKKMNAPAQFNAVATAIAKLDKGSAVDVATRLFGREGSGNIMQISRDMDGFQQTLAASAREAVVVARTAAMFDKLGDTITRIKGSLSGMFAGIGEGIVPTLQQVAKALNDLDLTAIGQDIGTMFSGAFQAFREGKLSMLIADSFMAGIEMAVAIAPSILQKLGTAILSLFTSPLTYIQASFQWITEKVMELAGSLPDWLIGGENAYKDFKSSSFGDILKESQATGPQFFTQDQTLESMNADANDRMTVAMDEIKSKWGDLFTKFTDFASRAPKGEEAAKNGQPGGGKGGGVLGFDGPVKGATALEKMGFITGSSALDPQKQTAKHTQSIVSEVRKTNALLMKNSGFTKLVNG